VADAAKQNTLCSCDRVEFPGLSFFVTQKFKHRFINKWVLELVMEKENIKEQIERWKILGELFLKENKRVFIKDILNNYYFADLIFVGENSFEIQCFAPEDRAGKKIRLYWAEIIRFDEYKEKEELKNDRS